MYVAPGPQIATVPQVTTLPQVATIPQVATVPQVAADPQAINDPNASRFTSSDFYNYNHDFDEPNKSPKFSDTTVIIDCVTSSGYQVRSSYQECMKLNDGNFNIRVNSKSNTDTDKQNELDLVQQNEDEYHIENEKKTIPYTGTYYSKSPNDGYHGSLSRSNSLLSTTSESVVNSGSEHIPSTSTNEISTLTGGEIDATDLYEPMDPTNNDEAFGFQYNDERNSIDEPESESESENEPDYSLDEDQEDLSSISDGPSLSSSDSRFLVSSISNLSQDHPYDNHSDSLNPAHDSPISDNPTAVDAGSADTLDQSDISDFDLEDEFPLPTSQTLPILSSIEDDTEIFGSTQPNYGVNLNPKSNIWAKRMHSSSMPIIQDQLEPIIDQAPPSEQGNQTEHEQTQSPSAIDQADTVIVPEVQNESEVSAEEMQFFEDEANDEDE